MRIFDKNDNLLESPDLDTGHLIRDRLLIAHHEAVEAVVEVWHYETDREYPNGGKDLKRVVDIQAVEAKEAWDEYEDIQRYIPFSAEELERRARAKRDYLLDASDKYAVMDAPISTECRAAMYAYRQALRDLPEQAGFPEEITWPELPPVIKAAPDPVDIAFDMMTEGEKL